MWYVVCLILGFAISTFIDLRHFRYLEDKLDNEEHYNKRVLDNLVKRVEMLENYKDTIENSRLKIYDSDDETISDLIKEYNTSGGVIKIK